VRVIKEVGVKSHLFLFGDLKSPQPLFTKEGRTPCPFRTPLCKRGISGALSIY